jgi:hypothetical protein
MPLLMPVPNILFYFNAVFLAVADSATASGMLAGLFHPTISIHLLTQNACHCKLECDVFLINVLACCGMNVYRLPSYTKVY